MLNKIFDRLDAIFCDPEGNPCFQGSDGDRKEYIDIRNAALAPVDVGINNAYRAVKTILHHGLADETQKRNGLKYLDELYCRMNIAAQGCFGVPEGKK